MKEALDSGMNYPKHICNKLKSEIEENFHE